MIVLLTAGPATGLDLQCRTAGVDLLLEKRHLHSRLLGFLQRRFPKSGPTAPSAGAASWSGR